MNKSEIKHPVLAKANQYEGNSRRSFLKKTAAASVLLASADLTFGAINPFSRKETEIEIPWFRRVTRWGQTNITEKDPAHYDISWWRSHWENTQTQGVIINAGGIVAYYQPMKTDWQFLHVWIRIVRMKNSTRNIRIGLPSMQPENLTKQESFLLPV
jgi:hypothetical protein